MTGLKHAMKRNAAGLHIFSSLRSKLERDKANMYTSDKSFISNNGRNINNKTDANITMV